MVSLATLGHDGDRSHTMPAEDHMGVLGCPSRAAPSCELLLFTDEPPSSQAMSWAATKSPSFLDWSYRCSPWRPRMSRGQRHRSIDRDTIAKTDNSHSNAKNSHSNQKWRSVNETPSSLDESTRAPSRATPSWPDFNTVSSSPGMVSPPSLPIQSPTLTHAYQLQHTTQASPAGKAVRKGAPRRRKIRPRGSSMASMDTTTDLHELTELFESALDGDSTTVGGSRSLTTEPTLTGSHSLTTEPTFMGSPSWTSGPRRSCHSPNEFALTAAADAAGARARGPVTIALRARVACRLAASTASRKLLYLQPQQARLRTAPPADTGGSDPVGHCSAGQDTAFTTVRCPSAQRVRQRPCRLSSTIMDHESSSSSSNGTRMASNG